jgi:hypothetical protein
VHRGWSPDFEAERTIKSIAAGLLAIFFLVPSAFADECRACFDATVSPVMCPDDGKSVTAYGNDRGPLKRCSVIPRKMARDVGILAAGSIKVRLDVDDQKGAGALVLSERREICPRVVDPPERVLTPEVLQEEDVRACPPIATELDREPNSPGVDEYLCGVYWRMSRRIDDSGDFTWKDAAAAARVRRTVCEFVIQGMHRDLREELYALGHQADEAGINWSFLSAFRDDYRQSIAAGFKAEPCRSWHGGSCRTKGWGDGQAADLWVADQNGDPAGDAAPLFELIDRVGRSLGLSRPMPGADPPHVQVGGDWRGIGEQLRERRLGIASATGD